MKIPVNLASRPRRGPTKWTRVLLYTRIMDMFSWFKRYFYPHDGNDHHPHLLRTGVSSFILSIILTGEAVFLFSIIVILPNTRFFADIFPNVVVDSTNIERQKMSESQLTISPLLQQAAQDKANDMALKGYFAHTGPGGITPWYWLEKTGYTYTAAGENLAVNFVDSQDVVNAWMNSPGHRANILNQNYTEIGIATSKGMYKGREATFVVQFFGRPDIQTAGDGLINQSTPSSPASSLIPPISLQQTASSLSAENGQVKSEAATIQTIPPIITRASFKDRLLSNPNGLMGDILLMFVFIFMLTTIFTVMIHDGTLKTSAILNGILSMAAIIALVYFNQYIGTLSAAIF